MRKVELTMKEQQRYEIIKKLVETDGNKLRASIKLGVTPRTINNLIRKYKEEGKNGFSHKNKGRKPANALSKEDKDTLYNLYISTQYENANVKHFCELVKEIEHISISDTTMRKILWEHNEISPKAHRKTRKRLKEQLKRLESEATTKSMKLEIQTKLVNIEDAHPHRPKSKFFGEMIQMDASSYLWFGTEITHLHIAVDDATGRVVGAYFDTQETLNAYYHVLHQILTNYGIPNMFYTDKRTVFEYQRSHQTNEELDCFTQFSYACSQLGIDIKTTSVPQAKGRVERYNQTLQSRLPIVLRLAGVQTIEAANEFLKSYLKKFNQQFSIPYDNINSVFEKQPSNKEINLILAKISNRIIDNGHCIKYKNNYYIPVNRSGTKQYFIHKTKALVIEAFDGKLYSTIDDTLYALEKVEKREAYSSNFDQVSPSKPKKYYIPPLSHPWKASSYNAFLEKQKHRPGANV